MVRMTPQVGRLLLDLYKVNKQKDVVSRLQITQHTAHHWHTEQSEL